MIEAGGRHQGREEPGSRPLLPSGPWNSPRSASEFHREDTSGGSKQTNRRSRRPKPMPPIPQPDLASPKFHANPYPFYARLRAEAPVYPVMLPGRQKAWLVTRYDDVVAIMKDERFVKDKTRAFTPEQAARQPWIPKAVRPLERNMLDLDAPDHTRLRSLVHKAFTPRLIEGLRPRIESLADELLDAATQRPSIDLIGDFAVPLPVTIIAEMLGVPTVDQHRFRRWSNVVVTADFSLVSRLLIIPQILAFLRY